MFWSAISSSSNFHSDDFETVLFLQSLSGNFEIKRNYAYIRLLDVLQVTWALVVEQMEFLRCLSFFVKIMILGDFGFLEKLKSPIQKKEDIDSWDRLESLQPIHVFLFVWFSKNRQPVLRGLCLTCLAINLANVLLNTRFHR